MRRHRAGKLRATAASGCGTGSGQRASGAGGGDSRQRVSGGSALMRGWAAGWAGAAAARPGCKAAGRGGHVQCECAASSPAGDAGTRATVGASAAADTSSVAGTSSSGRAWFIEVTAYCSDGRRRRKKRIQESPRRRGARTDADTDQHRLTPRPHLPPFLFLSSPPLPSPRAGAGRPASYLSPPAPVFWFLSSSSDQQPRTSAQSR